MPLAYQFRGCLVRMFGEKDGLKPDEQRLLELYRQLPEEEQQNMLRIVSLRLKELDELYAKYMGRRIKGDVE
ncbi:DNA-binding protein [Salmonella enterica subsp. arizonae]|uniref:DNA-binding protein n=1 Tax=Salmonella enterica subsp. arizonae TaxID=59203 RepID=A0A379ST65_SALER|nr:DNA-binding protein [Salmonella enterica subsp. arizonae]